MRKITLIIVFSLSLFVFSNTSKRLYADIGSVQIRNVNQSTDIEKVEYVFSNEQWYEITYYTDGTIDIVIVLRPPDF